ncbi:MAG: hypothetical protein ACI9OD_004335, partial [Limisphaerales bacterium]
MIQNGSCGLVVRRNSAAAKKGRRPGIGIAQAMPTRPQSVL